MSIVVTCIPTQYSHLIHSGIIFELWGTGSQMHIWEPVPHNIDDEIISVCHLINREEDTPGRVVLYLDIEQLKKLDYDPCGHPTFFFISL